jgi:hypothetical protein
MSNAPTLAKSSYIFARRVFQVKTLAWRQELAPSPPEDSQIYLRARGQNTIH